MGSQGFAIDRSSGSSSSGTKGFSGRRDANLATCPGYVTIDPFRQQPSVSLPDREPKHAIEFDSKVARIVPKKRARKERQMERSKTKGAGWYDLPATELTDERKHDLEILQMQSILDPKHFYKKPDLQVLPKYFQMGKIVEHATDFYTDRVPKKQRKQTMVDELLADADFQRFQKRKTAEIEAKRARVRPHKDFKKARMLKRKKR